MRSRALSVHGSCAHVPVSSTSIDKGEHVVLATDHLLVEPFNVNSFVDVFSDLKVDLRWLKKIHDLFIVNLQKATLDEELQGGSVTFLVDY
jgi:hypothetical protein